MSFREECCVKVSLGERSYDIQIKPGLLGEVGQRLHTMGLSGKVAVVTNPIIGRLYTSPVLRSLKAAGYDVMLIIVPAGERSKTIRSVSRVLDALAEARFERGSVLLALGGGVIGDLTGFAAAVYQRGIPFIQIPTTLVAQVDSSIGGKTGVNHRLGKNLIGALYQPRLVLIDPTTLKTLPRREWIAGLAEVIKYGMIADEGFFAYLEKHMDALLSMEEESVVRIITRSCEIKAAVVMEDERESDRRRILNYGHTIGHALESLGEYRTFVHGEAVAIGMVQEADISRTFDLVERQRDLVRRAGLPDALPSLTFSGLWEAMQHDKKVAQGRVYCVLPERIGEVRVAPLERTEFKNWFGNRQSSKAARVNGKR
ncbi:MAG: 3-dehydroquinate synthase [Nitrospiraceae bacterium]